MGNDLATKEQASKIIDFLENLRLREIQKEDSFYMDLRNNRVDNLNNLSNFLLVVSTILLPLSIGVATWDSSNLNSDKFFALNLLASILLIVSLFCGFKHILENDKYLKSSIELVNLKRFELYSTKYPIFDDKITTGDLTKFIEEYHQRLKSFDKINDNLTMDFNMVYLVIQGTLIFTALTALVIQFIISFNF